MRRKKKIPLPYVGYNITTGAQYVLIEESNLKEDHYLVSTQNTYPVKWWSKKKHIVKTDVKETRTTN